MREVGVERGYREYVFSVDGAMRQIEARLIVCYLIFNYMMKS